MVKLNENIISLEDKNVFLNVANEVSKFKASHPNCNVLSLGVGDVSRPIVKRVIKRMHEAVDELADMDTFKGYGNSSGYEFLKEKILENEYKDFGFTTDEVYISSGTKTDCTNILELFDINSKICITNSMYPIYRDGALCLNRKLTTLKVDADTNFIPRIPEEHYDIIYICSPSNPTGICYTYDELKEWIDYAIANNSVILYDNVYVQFMSSENVPKSIYEVDGAKKVAIEFRSFSKMISFTGVRCSYYIIPNELANDVNKLWKRRTINRFNGADYIAQAGAAASYDEESQKEINENIAYYKENAKILREGLKSCNFKIYGGIDAPYIWVKTKNNMTSWEFFYFFLEKLNIIIIPGIVFGEKGDEYFRVSSLAPRDIILKSIERIKNYYENQEES